nr:methionine aminopeptidase-like [Lytechinus pictus]
MLVKSPEEIAKARVAAGKTAQILQQLKRATRVGGTGLDLDAVARRLIEEAGCKSNFLGYRGFPAAVCISRNEELIHGIPNSKPFSDGDLISIDFGCSFQGQHADAAISFILGKSSAKKERILDLTNRCLEAVISKISAGDTTEDIAKTIESVCSGTEFRLTADFGGHGIGKQLHEPPQILNVSGIQEPVTLLPGMIICVEPMLLTASPEIKISADN